MTFNILKSNYLDLIDAFISKSYSEEQVEDLFQKISAPSSLLIIDEPFRDSVKKLLHTRPGRKLFKSLSQTKSSISVKRGEQTEFDQKSRTIFVNLDKKNFTVHIDKNGVRKACELPIEIKVAHEAIHAMHYMNDSKAYLLRGCERNALVDEEFGDLEEQFTTLGIIGSIKQKFISKDLEFVCENSFLRSFGLDLRINHKGITRNQDEYLELSQYITLNIHKTVEAYLEKTPSLIDTPLKFGKTTLTPLSIAVFNGNVEMFTFLTSKGASLVPKDGCATMLHPALSGRHPNPIIVKQLMENYHIDPNVTDTSGKTALDCLIQSIIRAKKSEFQRYNQKQKKELFVLLKELNEKGAVAAKFSKRNKILLNCKS